MFLLRRLVHDGSPVSTISNTLLYDISLRVDGLAALTRPQKDWLSRLLTTGMFKHYVKYHRNMVEGSAPIL